MRWLLQAQSTLRKLSAAWPLSDRTELWSSIILMLTLGHLLFIEFAVRRCVTIASSVSVTHLYPFTSRPTHWLRPSATSSPSSSRQSFSPRASMLSRISWFPFQTHRDHHVAFPTRLASHQCPQRNTNISRAPQLNDEHVNVERTCLWHAHARHRCIAGHFYDAGYCALVGILGGLVAAE